MIDAESTMIAGLPQTARRASPAVATLYSRAETRAVCAPVSARQLNAGHRLFVGQASQCFQVGNRTRKPGAFELKHARDLHSINLSTPG